MPRLDGRGSLNGERVDLPSPSLLSTGRPQRARDVRRGAPLRRLSLAMGRLDDMDVLREVRRGPIPARVARRDKLLALREEALALVEARDLARPRAVWRIVQLDGEPGQAGLLRLDGREIEAPWLMPASGRLTAVACAVATIGAGVDEQVSTLFAERRASLAMALDGVGNELLFALSRRVQDRLLADARRRGLTVAGELRAGDPGLGLHAQRTVLELAGAAEIGVSVTRTMMMSPNKSTSIVQGVGLELPAQTWSRCDSCRSRERCTLAREPA